MEHEYSPEEKVAIRKEIAEMNKLAAELWKGGPHPRVRALREQANNVATDYIEWSPSTTNNITTEDIIMEDYYAPWEWMPIQMMADGCSDVEVKTVEGQVEDMCSCDYWWLSKERKSAFVSFRFK